VTLPRSYLVANWPLAWTGFDAILLGCLATTAWALHKQRQVAVPASIITSALLFCDAWFDILTAHSGLCRSVSIATALLAEIPLALLLSLISGRLLRATVRAGSPEINQAQLSIWRTPLLIQTTPSSGTRRRQHSQQHPHRANASRGHAHQPKVTPRDVAYM
jgi:hypothetical protein